jgi:hypothetical protein
VLLNRAVSPAGGARWTTRVAPNTTPSPPSQPPQQPALELRTVAPHNPRHDTHVPLIVAPATISPTYRTTQLAPEEPAGCSEPASGPQGGEGVQNGEAEAADAHRCRAPLDDGIGRRRPRASRQAVTLIRHCQIRAHSLHPFPRVTGSRIARSPGVHDAPAGHRKIEPMAGWSAAWHAQHGPRNFTGGTLRRDASSSRLHLVPTARGPLCGPISTAK